MASTSMVAIHLPKVVSGAVGTACNDRNIPIRPNSVEIKGKKSDFWHNVTSRREPWEPSDKYLLTRWPIAKRTFVQFFGCGNGKVAWGSRVILPCFGPAPRLTAPALICHPPKPLFRQAGLIYEYGLANKKDQRCCVANLTAKISDILDSSMMLRLMCSVKLSQGWIRDGKQHWRFVITDLCEKKKMFI